MYQKILVCLDGSALAEQIIPFAVEQALHFRGKLVFLRVVTESGFVGIAVPGFPGVPVESRGVEKQFLREENEAREYLEKLADKLLKERGVKADCIQLPGIPGETIVNYASENNIELIALATHGRTGPGRVLLGSVADFVVRHISIPILLIRPV